MCETRLTLGQERLAALGTGIPRCTDSCTTSSKRRSEEIEFVGWRPVKQQKTCLPHRDAAYGKLDLMDGPPPNRQGWVPAPIPSRPYDPKPDLRQRERGSTGMVKLLPPVSSMEIGGGHSLSGLHSFSLNQPDHQSRLPSLSPISPKQNGETVPAPVLRKGATAFEATSSAPAQAALPADSLPLLTSDHEPATVQPRALPAGDKPTTPAPSHPGHTLPHGEQLGVTPSPSESPRAQAAALAGLAQSRAACCYYCAAAKQNVAHPRTSGLPAMGLPTAAPPQPYPNIRPPIYAHPPTFALPPHLPRAPFSPILPPSVPHGYGQGLAPLMKPMPLKRLIDFRGPPLATSPGHPVVRPKPAGSPEMPKPAVAALRSAGTQTQAVRPGRESPFLPHPGLIQLTYRKTSPNLVVDVAETCQEKFPFHEVAARHHTSVDKVADVFAAIIQVPLLRCPTDRRRAGKLATARIKDFNQAKKSITDNAGDKDADTGPVAVAEHMGPLELPDGSVYR